MADAHHRWQQGKRKHVMKIQSSIVTAKVIGACKRGASVLLMIAPMACALETGIEGELGSEEEVGTVEQEKVTSTERSRIDAKWTANKNWLGAPYDPNTATAYWETSAGIVRQYYNGAVLYNRSTSKAYVADWDAYYGWSWIGGGYFGYPIEDQRSMVSNSSNKVVPFADGFIVTKPSTRDNWPVMKVVNHNYNNGGATIWCDTPSPSVQNQPVALTCVGFNFPKNTTVQTGYSGRAGMLHAVTRSTGSTGTFTAQLRPGGGVRVDAYNGIITIFARSATGIATYQSLDYRAYSSFLNETKNLY